MALKLSNFNLDKITKVPAIKKIIFNSSWLLVEKVIRILVGFFVGIWMARYLHPDNLGVLNYGIAFVAILAPFSSLGLNGIVVKEFVKDPDDTNEILITSLILRLIGAAFCLTIIILCMLFGWLGSVDQSLVILIIGVGMLFQTSEIFNFWFQSKVLSKYTVIAKTSSFLISAGVKVALILLKAPVVAFACVLTLDYLLGFIFLAIIFIKKSDFIIKIKSFKFIRAKEMLKQSWPLVLSGIGVAIYMKIDQIMIGNMVGMTEVGTYSVAVTLAEMWQFIPSIILVSAFPMLIESKKLDEVTYKKRFQNMYDLLFLIALLFAVPFTFFSNNIVLTLYGSDYASSAPNLSLHIWGSIFVFMRYALSRWFIIENLTKFSLVSHGFGAIVNVVLNLFLIPAYAGIGASIATIIAYLFSTIIACLVYSKTRDQSYMMLYAMTSPVRYLFKGVRKLYND